MRFKVGDLVRLNSGGPVMIVIGQHGTTRQVLVSWQHGGARQDSAFPEACLTPVIDEETS